MNDPVESEQLAARLGAVRTEAFQQARRINRLKTALLVLSVLALVLAAIYLASRASEPVGLRPPDEKETGRRIIALEKELALLKTDLGLVRPTHPLVGALKTATDFAIANWVLLSFVAAIGTALYVKFHFGIDYFESYRDLATKKMLSEFYRRLGDRLMVNSEWEAAEEAYRGALEINPTNIQATYGVAKVRIFQPLKGQKYYSPEVADAKLDYLIEHTPEDAQLYFLKSINRLDQGDRDTARELLQKCLSVDPRFVGAHLQMGYLLMGTGEITQAIASFKRTLELDPSYSLANNNLGFCCLITLQLDEAIRCLRLAYKVCPNLLTALNLGNAYRFAGDFASALSWHRSMIAVIGQPDIEKERYVGGAWLYNFMPLRKGDTDTIRRNVEVFTFAQKKCIAFFALAFDLALTGDFANANKKFDQARALDTAGEYGSFLINKIESMLNLLALAPDAAAWFEGKKRALLSPTEGGFTA